MPYFSYTLHLPHAQKNSPGHPAAPEEIHKPINPDPDTPYEPIEPAEPDVQPPIIGDR